jgi:predicted nucleotidyltransferase
MSDLITELGSDERVRAACERYGVRALYLFGSRTRPGEAREDSDIDLLVSFRPMAPHDLADAYFGLKDDLADALEVPVDLVMESALTNRYLRENIDRTKRMLYAA